jgi:hypothetical protein
MATPADGSDGRRHRRAAEGLAPVLTEAVEETKRRGDDLAILHVT